jgi:hypothetical protein
LQQTQPIKIPGRPTSQNLKNPQKKEQTLRNGKAPTSIWPLAAAIWSPCGNRRPCLGVTKLALSPSHGGNSRQYYESKPTSTFFGRRWPRNPSLLCSCAITVERWRWGLLSSTENGLCVFGLLKCLGYNTCYCMTNQFLKMKGFEQKKKKKKFYNHENGISRFHQFNRKKVCRVRVKSKLNKPNWY